MDPLRILLVLPHPPYPPVHGGAVRMWNVLRTLSTRHEVNLLAFHEVGQPAAELDEVASQIGKYARQVRLVPRQPAPYGPDLFGRLIHLEMFECAEMRAALQEMTGASRYEVVQFHKLEMARYARSKPAPIQVLVEHIIFHRAYQREFLRWSRAWPARLIEFLGLRRYELKACDQFDAVLAMSEDDARYLRRRLPSHPCIVEGPNGVDSDFYQPTERTSEASDILFVGNFEHSPNVDGVRFFLREVYPVVTSAMPDARLLVVGPGHWESLPEVASDPRIVVTGRVEDTRPYLAKSAVFVAPIRAGSGTRVKILEAMAAGTPVVSTTVGIEGIEAIPGKHALVADRPRDFAAAVIRLLREPHLRDEMSVSARSLVDERYSWQVVGERLDAIYRDLIAAKA